MLTAGGSSVLVRGFRLALQVEGRRPATIKHYVRDVERLLAYLGDRDLASLKAADLREYFAVFQQTHAPKTVREAQLAARRFFRFLASEGELQHDPTRELKLATYRVRPQPTYTEAEVKRLLLACGANTSEGVRNKALFLTLYDTGVREGELVSMGLPDFERREVTVEGKTGVRVVSLGLTALQALERYVRRWRIGGAPLWRGKRGALTGSGVLQLVRRLCRETGVEFKGVHAFRRAAAVNMKRLGMNDSDILEVMGWRNVEMLRRYTAQHARQLAQAAHRRYSPADAL